MYMSCTDGWDDVGSYTLEEQFARGGFGEVWRGTSREALPKLTRIREGVSAEHFVLKRVATAKGVEVSALLVHCVHALLGLSFYAC